MAPTNQKDIRFFAFCSGWGLPVETSGPFPLKLATWMRMVGLDYTYVEENNTTKGPKGKSPWIEHDGVAMGDSTLIAEYLHGEYDLPDLDKHLTKEQRALSVVVQRMLEEHYHQCFEHQLFFGRGGRARLLELAGRMPPVVRTLLPPMLTRAFGKQLHARGMGRHPEDVIIAQGKSDLDALSVLLGDNKFFHGDKPSSIDACIFGFLGVSVYVEGDNPMYNHAASLPNLYAYCERMRETYFPETAEKLAFQTSTARKPAQSAA